MTHKSVIILGTGGHAKVIAEALKLTDRKVLGFTTPDLDIGINFCGMSVLGDDSVIFDYSIDDIELAIGVGALPGQNLRWELASLMRNKGYHLITVVHPNAVVAADVVLAEGVQVMAGVVVQPGTTVGKDTIINTGAIIDHDCTISENCHLAPGVVCSGGVSIGKNTHIGTAAKVIQGMNIGEGSVIAAGSTIYKDVPAGVFIRHQLNTVMKGVKE